MTCQKLLELQDKYQGILLADGGLRTLCNTLSKEINNPVLILNKYQDDIIYADRGFKQGSLLGILLNNRASSVKTIKTKYGFSLEKANYGEGRKSFEVLKVQLGREEPLGILCVLLENKVTEEGFLAISQACNVLSIKLYQNYLVQRLVQKSSTDLIETLLQGKLQEREAIIKKGELAGWDLTVPYQLFVFDYKINNFYEQKDDGYVYEVEEQIIRNLHRIIKTNISRKYIIFSYNNKILLLIHYPEFSKKVKDEIKIIMEKLKNSCPKLEFNIGAGSFIKECCCKISNSYQEGLYILDFLRTTGRWNKIFFYDELGILSLLWKVEPADLKKFVDEHISKLIAYDEKNNNQWLMTLAYYIEEEGSIQAAAERAHIHPNTISYRIKRIEEILGYDIHKFETKLNLIIAYKIYKYILQADEKGGDYRDGVDQID